MIEHFASVAERLRVASRLVEEASDLLAPGAAMSHLEYSQEAGELVQSLDILFALVGALAGKDYLDALRGRSDRTTWLLGMLSGHLLQMERRELVRLAGEPEFAYRDMAAMALLMRDRLDGKAAGDVTTKGANG